MASKNILTDGRNLGIAGGILSIISVFLPWYSASANAGMLGLSSSFSVNGLGWKNGEGLLMGLASGTANWEFQGIGVLALGIATILVAVLLKDKIQSLAMLACGLLIIGGGVVNLKSIGSFSGEFMGATMQSGVGYGLFVVVLAGAVASAGGLLAWRDINN
ncbi:MAG: hypothetical protein PHH85_09270 [Candidatus Methanoperedens sp.]|nr:hypothetical protein [Candidatus Methanoperedens sp.]